jgi:transaldolase
LADETDYDSAIQKILVDSPDIGTPALFEKIEIEDLQMAADVLRPVYERTGGSDGFVSIEVSPHLAYDTERSIAEARRLWGEVNRKNLMVKIPATTEGIPAIEQLLAESININITLMFSVSQYEQVAEAYLRAMQRNSNPHAVTSVASFFVSRVDTAVDRALGEIGTSEALAMRGKAGIANAQLAYRRFRQIFSVAEFAKMKSRGIRIQKPLWASTGTKNKAYSDVMYIEGLIAPDTINSIPPETLAAFRDHGKAQIALSEDTTEAGDVVGRLLELDIRLTSIGLELTNEGVEKFIASYDQLVEALDRKRASLAKAA